MIGDKYEYEFIYTYGANVLARKFNADTNIYELKENLIDFLKGSGWNEDVLNEIFKKDSDD